MNDIVESSFFLSLNRNSANIFLQADNKWQSFYMYNLHVILHEFVQVCYAFEDFSSVINTLTVISLLEIVKCCICLYT
jgi:hypothetical protein